MCAAQSESSHSRAATADMSAWLLQAVDNLSADESALGWMMGRGLTEERVRDIRAGLWDQVMSEDAPDQLFRDRYGPRGARLQGYLTFPIWSPRGHLLGVEARTWGLGVEKHIAQIHLPNARWNPVFIGLTPSRMDRIWAGSDVWLVEGVFDMGAMEHMVTQDVVLSTLRARVSSQHVAFFQRFLKGKIHMAYDNDETGRQQTLGYVDARTGKKHWGALDQLKRVGIHASDEPYRGKDPGEVWEREGTSGLRQSFGVLR